MPKRMGLGGLTPNECPAPSSLCPPATGCPDAADATHAVLLVVFAVSAFPRTFRVRRGAAHGPTRNPEGGASSPGRSPRSTGTRCRLYVVAVVDHDATDAHGRFLGVRPAERVADVLVCDVCGADSALRSSDRRQGGPALRPPHLLTQLFDTLARGLDRADAPSLGGVGRTSRRASEALSGCAGALRPLPARAFHWRYPAMRAPQKTPWPALTTPLCTELASSLR